MADSSGPPSDTRDTGPHPHRFPGYEILGELGRGATGVVYRGYDLKRRNVVAIKTLHRDESAWLHRFKSEFRSLQAISHPNLVAFYQLLSDGDVWFLTMELIEGCDFLDYVEFGPAGRPPGGERSVVAGTPAPRPLNDQQLERLRGGLRQLVQGVQALHRRHIVHRDIKPSNVLVTRQGRVVLLDFGLAVQLTGQELAEGAKTRQGLVGTAYYMSPEQSQSQPPGLSSDWYSLGVMLYEALTGCLPFQGSIVEVILKKESQDPPAPRHLVPEVPVEWNDLCLGLLRRDPRQRLSDEDLTRILGLPRDEEGSTSDLFEDVRLVGRRSHLAALHDAFQAMRRQQATVSLFVHGPSGQGKSVLMRQFLREATRAQNVVVLSGRCYERESVPFKALDSLVDDLADYLGCLAPAEVERLLPAEIFSLARVFPVLNEVPAIGNRAADQPLQADQQQLRNRAFGALRALLARIGRKAPLILCVDDLQWGDVDSAALLSELLLPPDAPPLLLLGSYRSDECEQSPFLRRYGQLRAQLGQPLADREVEVGPLSAHDSLQLAQSLLDRLAPDAVEHAPSIAAESGGNPFFLAELVRHVGATADAAEPDVGRGQLNLDEVLWSRVARMPSEEARRLLQVIAIAGQPLRISDAFTAAAVGSQDPGVLTRLQTASLVRTLGGTEDLAVETYHDRVREAVSKHVAAELQVNIHLRLAEVCERGGAADPEFLAVHYDGANRGRQAGRWYALAADRAMEALAFDRAARLYRRALQLREAGHPPEEEAAIARLRERLGDALANAGRGGEAARAYLEATRHAAAERVLPLKRAAAMQYVLSGHLDEGLQALRDVLDAIGVKLAATPLQALGLLLLRRWQLTLRGLGFEERREGEIEADELTLIDTCWTVGLGLSVVDPIRGAEFLTRALLRALRAGEPGRIARVLALEAGHVSAAGGAARRQTTRLLREAEVLAERVDDPTTTAIVSLCKGIASYLQGRWQTCLELCDRALAVFEDQCTGVTWEQDTAQTFSLWSLTYQGELAELRRRRARALQEARARGDLYAVTNFSTYIMAFDRLAGDQEREGRDELREAMQRWTQRGFHVQHHNALLGETLLDLYCGRGQEAWRRIERLWPAYRRSLLLRVQQVRIDLLQSRARSALAAARETGARQTGDRERLLRRAARDAARLDRERMPWASALAQLIRAAVVAAQGPSDEAAAEYQRAAEWLEDVDMRLFAAAARWRRAEIVGGVTGSALRDQAEEWLRRQQIQVPSSMVALVVPDFRHD